MFLSLIEFFVGQLMKFVFLIDWREFKEIDDHYCYDYYDW